MSPLYYNRYGANADAGPYYSTMGDKQTLLMQQGLLKQNFKVAYL